MKNVGTYTIDPEVLKKTANHMKGTLGYTAVQPSMDKGVYRSPDPELERKPSKLTPKEEESLHDKEKAMQEFQSRPTSVNISFGPTAKPATQGPEVNQNWKSAGVYNTNSNNNTCRKYSSISSTYGASSTSWTSRTRKRRTTGY